MPKFELRLTGDLIDSAGQPIGDLALDVLDAAPQVHYAFLREHQAVSGDTSYGQRLYSLEIGRNHVAEADGIIVCRPWLKAAALTGGAERLVAVGRAGVGYDKIDLQACTEHDVVVFNAPDGLTHATASAALLFILALAKRLPLQERLVRTHRWDLQKDAMGDDLTGQMLGIVGLGQTGQELVRLLAPFGMHVIAYSPHADRQQAAALGVTLVDTLDDVFARADFVSLHGRLTQQTHRMIGQRQLALMKPTAYFVNVARGEMVDQPALVRVLQERRIAGAGLDVFEHEPPAADDPLLTLDNVMLTPHWLCSTRQASRLTMTSVITGMLHVAAGELPANILNPAVVDRPGFRAKLAQQAARTMRPS
jgi:phosphoglycerate dehydrogenase-like enzyme